MKHSKDKFNYLSKNYFLKGNFYIKKLIRLILLNILKLLKFIKATN